MIRVQQLLPPQYSRPVVRLRVKAVCFDLPLATKVLAALSPFPLGPGAAFLKRITKREGQGLALLGPEQEAALAAVRVQVPDSQLIEVEVPEDAPLTKQQYKQAHEIWPVIFRQTGYQLAQVQPAFTQLLGELLAEPKAQAWLVDPATNKVLLSACSDRSSPISHATMRLMESWGELSVEREMKARLDKEPQEQHLCSGLDVVLVREPCVMCAMALVHSRVRRVFWGRDREEEGGIVRYGVNSLKALNHSYLAFRVGVGS